VRLLAAGTVGALALIAPACGGEETTSEDTTSTILATEGGESEPEEWTGRWREGNEAMTSSGTFTLTVAPDGTVTGEGKGTQETGGVHATYDVAITGTRDEDAFHLTFTSEAGSLDVEAAIQGDTAKGPWRTGAGQAAYGGRIRLECQNCSG
jgi:hypothetical protein